MEARIHPREPARAGSCAGRMRSDPPDDLGRAVRWPRPVDDDREHLQKGQPRSCQPIACGRARVSWWWGSITADLTTFSERLPAPGETILGDDFTLVLGGKGANQAIASALAGTETHMVACVGSDLFSDMVTSGLRDAAVRIVHVRRVPGPTGIAHIRVDGNGENDIVMVPLANGRMTTEQIDRAFTQCGDRVGVLLTQLEIPWI